VENCRQTEREDIVNRQTRTIVILFAGVVSAIAAGKMLGNVYGDSMKADFRAHQERNKVEMQQFEDRQTLEIQRARAERERRIGIIQERIASE
jgi:hypothetical protein